MHMTITPPLTEPCAVIQAGSSILLALVSRSGRFPIAITSTSDNAISWIAKDGQPEQIVLEGPTAPTEHQQLCNELANGGLLVAEVNALEEINTDEAHFWLVDETSKPDRERNT